MIQIVCISALAALLACSGCSGDRADPLPAPRTQTLTVDHSLPAFDGKLLGTDRGEWIGKLMYQDETGKIHVLINENVHGIIENEAGIFAFTGLSHLGTNDGYIHVITQAPDRTVKTKLLGRLPGAPSQVQQQSNGSANFLVYAGYRDDSPYYECYALAGSTVDHSLDCFPPKTGP